RGFRSGRFAALTEIAIGNHQSHPRRLGSSDMDMPDGFPHSSRSEVDLLLFTFLQREVVAAKGERVAAGAFGGNAQDNLLVTQILKRDLEVEDAVTTQIDIIKATRKDGNARV